MSARFFRTLKGYCLVVAAILLVCGAGCHKQPEAPPSGAMPKVSTTLAVLPFENNSVTSHDHYDPLCQGFAAMLITDLKQRSVGLTLIERSRIGALLSEMELAQAGLVNEDTALKVGRMLGAEHLVIGSFMVVGWQVRVDARLVRVETAEVLLAQSVSGGKNWLISLQSELAEKIAGSLDVRLAPGTTGKEMGDMEAAVWFSSGVHALDLKDKARAKECFDKCAVIDPAYKPQIAALIGASEGP